MNKEEVFRQLIEEAPATQEKIFLSAVWLFSTKGYERVGIRELCRTVGIKESSFYNHYPSKDDLLKRIFAYFRENAEKTVLTDEDIDGIVESGDVGGFFQWAMRKFSSYTGNPLFHTVLQIMMMERFTNPEAYEIEKRNLYCLRKDQMEKALGRMLAKGLIRDCDVGLVTAEYCYGLMGLLDEYLLRELWHEDLTEIQQKIMSHVAFFTNMLGK